MNFYCFYFDIQYFIICLLPGPNKYTLLLPINVSVFLSKKHDVISTSNKILTSNVKKFNDCINAPDNYTVLQHVNVNVFFTKWHEVNSTSNDILTAKLRFLNLA